MDSVGLVTDLARIYALTGEKDTTVGDSKQNSMRTI